MKKYKVTYKTSYVVEAENEDEALKKADKRLECDIDDSGLWSCLDFWNITELNSEN